MSLIRKNTWLVMLLAIGMSFGVPEVGIFLKPYLNYLLMLLMFLSCLDIELLDLWKSFLDYKKYSKVLIIVHLVSPIIIWFLKPFLSEEIFLGLILASVTPTARSAVFLSNIYGGETEKALVVSFVSNLLSPIVVPLLVWFFAKTSIEINVTEMGTTILKLVVIPIVAALIVRQTRLAKKLAKQSSNISVLVLFLIIMGIIAPIKNMILDDLQTSIILLAIVVALNIFCFALGYMSSKKHSEKITYAISSFYRNYTLATVLALSLFSPTVALPSIVYTIIGNMLLIPLQLITKVK